MRFLLTLCALLFSFNALAQADQVCVRNYLGGNPGVDPCANGGGIYFYVVNVDTPDLKICTQAYPDLTCEFYPKEYRLALGVDGQPICVVHYDQPGVGNYCQGAPDLYTWVTGVE